MLQVVKSNNLAWRFERSAGIATFVHISVESSFISPCTQDSENSTLRRSLEEGHGSLLVVK
jgi:hypothetical protein